MRTIKYVKIVLMSLSHHRVLLFQSLKEFQFWILRFFLEVSWGLEYLTFQESENVSIFWMSGLLEHLINIFRTTVFNPLFLLFFPPFLFPVRPLNSHWQKPWGSILHKNPCSSTFLLYSPLWVPCVYTLAYVRLQSAGYSDSCHPGSI